MTNRLFEHLAGRLNRTRKKGHPGPHTEKHSGIPVEMPSGAARPLSMKEMVQRYIREEVSRSASQDDGQESWEEANDFTEEDPDTIPLTHHQVIAMDDSELREEAMSSYGIDLVDDRPEAPQEERAPGQSGTAPGSPGGTQPPPSGGAATA